MPQYNRLDWNLCADKAGTARRAPSRPVAELAQGRARILILRSKSCGGRFTELAPSARRGNSIDWSSSAKAEADAREDELAAEQAKRPAVKSFERKRPTRKPFPEHLPREQVVIPAPETCPCCVSAKLSKLGEDITETPEVVPRRWKGVFFPPSACAATTRRKFPSAPKFDPADF
jgi:hypothetical protein